MTEKKPDNLEYTILNPTGNITALVETDVELSRHPLVAAELMQRHPEVEQVGFVSYGPSPALRMAGGEFCGNAAMCAAVLCAMKQGALTDPTELYIRVSGAALPVKIGLAREGKDNWRTWIRMPEPAGIEKKEFAAGDKRGMLPVVSMGGITHIIVEADAVFGYLSEDSQAAESAVKKWCGELSAEGLGLMFLTDENVSSSGKIIMDENVSSSGNMTQEETVLSSDKMIPAENESSSGKMISNSEMSQHGSDTVTKVYGLRPMVFIPGSGTVFWENSCASGSAAAAIYLAGKDGAFTDVTLLEPGGKLRVTSNPACGETWLYGQVRVTLRRDASSA